ncbi:K02A2.6-like [Cordylochernes scorpioides]|uniref:K02A2.6-like n=1 Tax=Cordylochernes scorpioides TaxID=51811 RepID=A0ABY6L4G5_9ARAC|nr:K02A2.6-like [Cordylochernes scorpioides]
MSNIPVPAPILINSQAAENWRFFKSQWDNYQVATEKNVIYERYIFNTSNQEENEGIDSYTNRLRGLASACEYDIITEELIIDRIVLGIKDNRVRKKILMEPKLNLSSAIDICRTAEVTEQQITKLTGQESEDVKWNKKYERKIKRPKLQMKHLKT